MSQSSMAAGRTTSSREAFQSDYATSAVVGRYLRELGRMNERHDEVLADLINALERRHAAGNVPASEWFAAWKGELRRRLVASGDVVSFIDSRSDQGRRAEDLVLEVVQACPEPGNAVGFVAYSVRATARKLQFTSVRLPVIVSRHSIVRAVRRSDYDPSDAISVIASSIPMLMAMSACGYMPTYVVAPAGRGIAHGFHDNESTFLEDWREGHVFQTCREFSRNWDLRAGMFLGRQIAPIVVKTYYGDMGWSHQIVTMSAELERWVGEHGNDMFTAFHEYAFPAGDAAEMPFLDAKITPSRRMMLSDLAGIVQGEAFHAHNRKLAARGARGSVTPGL